MVIVAAATYSGEAAAQSADARVLRTAQVFVSNGAKVRRIGGQRSVLHFGFGLDWLRPNGLGLGLEIGPRFEDHDFSRLDDLMFSIDARYERRSHTAPRKVAPFLAGGLAFTFEPVPDGVEATFVSVAGGINYWMLANHGIRLELRDAMTLAEPDTGYHHVGFRVGYTWRIGQR